MNYIIDFERVNQLTTHLKDKEVDGPMGNTVLSPHGVSRKIIKDYLEIYHTFVSNKLKGRVTSDVSEERFNMIVDTLLYNGILVDKRDKRIEQVLN